MGSTKELDNPTACNSESSSTDASKSTDFTTLESRKRDEPYFLPKWPKMWLSSRQKSCCESSSTDEESSISSSSVQRVKYKAKNQQKFIPAFVTKKLIFQCFQVVSVLICLVCLFTLVKNVISLINSEEPSYSSSHTERETAYSENENENERSNAFSIHEELKKNWLINDGPLDVPLSRSLLDIKDFYYVLNNSTICENSSSNENSINGKSKPGHGTYLMVLVHSAPANFEARSSIRSTWGSVRVLKNLSIHLVFLLGKDPNSNGESETERNSLERAIVQESELYGDIVSGNFIDTYKNLTYKHLMGYKWALSFCPEATFFLKTDDDVFIDIFQLFDFTTRSYGFNPENTLICNVFPEGTKAVRSIDHDKNDGAIKWAVTKEEFPYEVYPKYCGGLAYLATPDVIRHIYAISRNARFLWIDDVFVTGILRELANKEPFYMNLRYSYDPEEYRGWLDAQHRFRKIPWFIVHVDRGISYGEEMSRLWRKTLRAWSHN